MEKTVIFDRNNAYWTNDPEYNLLFIRSELNYLEDKLKAHGVLSLWEVIVELGYDQYDIPADMIMDENDNLYVWIYGNGNKLDYLIDPENINGERSIILSGMVAMSLRDILTKEESNDGRSEDD